jgi:hypothetical protein
MHDQPSRQTCHISGSGWRVKRALPLAQPLMQVVQRPTHALSRQCVYVAGLGLLKKLGYIGGRDGVVVEAGFEPLQTECCQHQQRRNKRSEQPRHKGEVNTAKVSVGSRIATGPHRSAPWSVRPAAYAGIRDGGTDFSR